MGTYTQIFYHIIFGTYKRERTLKKSNRNDLFKYISGILKNNSCHLYRINGVEDHLHIAAHLHPTVSLAKLVKDIKLSTTEFIKSEKLFPMFSGWQEGYGAFTFSSKDKERIIEYIIHQEEHHKKVDFKEEYINILKENNIEFNEKYLV